MTEETAPRSVFVTGAAERLGRVIALTLAKDGWDILLHYHRAQTEAESTAHEIKALGRQVSLLQADFTDPQQVRRLTQEAPAFTALVNNASLFEHDDRDSEGLRHDAVNVQAPWLLSRALHQRLTLGQTGSIVHLLDNTPLPSNLSRYAKSKETLRDSIAPMSLELAPTVRLNGVALGPTLKNERQSEKHFQGLIEACPLRRPSAPEDVASAVSFLLSNNSITGQVVNVDAGMHLFSR